MKSQVVDSFLIKKYNEPVPRYTSYPPVPSWNDKIELDTWRSLFKKSFDMQNHVSGISLYIHLPFCESLCTYCGCNKKITTNHHVEEDYIKAIHKEWSLYRQLMTQAPVIHELHLGGGTPTFFSPANLQRLLQPIFKGSVIHPRREFSVEAHPNNTTNMHLQVLAGMGFNRISFGVQDNNPEVQRVINRIQPLENVRAATENARAHGFKSVNFDLIYGLPLQTEQSIERTINEILELRPSRIAFYSYAHVPWTSKAQRLFDESHLPTPEEKLNLYIKGKEILVAHGYAEIGIDHFALPSDDLYAAWQEGKLHRNFMGYTTRKTGLLLGLGVSSISDVSTGYAQNEKTLHDYYDAINNNRLAVKKGYVLSPKDISIKKYILDISCNGKTEFLEKDIPMLRQYCFPKLAALAKDGLIELTPFDLELTEIGHYFTRNVCAAFDPYLEKSGNEGNLFSKAV